MDRYRPAARVSLVSRWAAGTADSTAYLTRDAINRYGLAAFAVTDNSGFSNAVRTVRRGIGFQSTSQISNANTAVSLSDPSLATAR